MKRAVWQVSQLRRRAPRPTPSGSSTMSKQWQVGHTEAHAPQPWQRSRGAPEVVVEVVAEPVAQAAVVERRFAATRSRAAARKRLRRASSARAVGAGGSS